MKVFGIIVSGIISIVLAVVLNVELKVGLMILPIILFALIIWFALSSLVIQMVEEEPTTSNAMWVTSTIALVISMGMAVAAYFVEAEKSRLISIYFGVIPLVYSLYVLSNVFMSEQFEIIAGELAKQVMAIIGQIIITVAVIVVCVLIGSGVWIHDGTWASIVNGIIGLVFGALSLIISYTSISYGNDKKYYY